MAKENPPSVVANTPSTGMEAITVDNIRALIAQGKLREARELLETKKMLEEAEKEFTSKEEAARAQEARLLAIQQEIQEREEMQANCSHLKEDNKPAIGGQRDHDNVPTYVCLNCNKLFRGGELPAYLRIRSDMVGGIGG